MPIVFINNNLTNNKIWLGVIIMLLWGGGAHWAYWAYHFEFEGWHTFAEIQYACYIWFGINIYCIYSFIVNHKVTITRDMLTHEKVREE